VSTSRPYVSPRRQAQAAATRAAIVEAFVEQLSEAGRDTLSPVEAARRVGVSVRTVHLYFPNLESQIEAVGAWYDEHLYPGGVQVARGPDDLPRYFRDIHAMALSSAHTPVALVLLQWPEIRQPRRAPRLEAIRRAVAAIGAPAQATENATAMLLSLSGLDASWPMHDLYGLPLERIPDVIANTVRLVIEDLQSQVHLQHQLPRASSRRTPRTPRRQKGSP
jgi:AcrR family transcriptional regulator